MAIQNRRGANADFNPAKMLPGEFGFTTDGSRKIYGAFAPNDVKELAGMEDVNRVMGHIKLVAGGTAPIGVSLASQMTDTTKFYLYTGTETGYIKGNWYYYDGTAWVSGGKYGAEVDETLTQNGKAADAKVVGDRLGELSEKIADAESTFTPTKTTQGTTVTVDDASGTSFAGMKLYGKTKQGENPSPSNPQELESRGKWGNLLENTLKSQTINGVTITRHEDGSFTANGTATSAVSLPIGEVATIKGEKYKLNGCPNGGSTRTFYIYKQYGTDKNAFDTGNGFIFTEEGETKQVHLVIMSGATVNNITFQPQLTYAEDNITSYRPYTGQKEIDVSVHSTNLLEFDDSFTQKESFNYSLFTEKEIKVTKLSESGNGNFFAVYECELVKDETYITSKSDETALAIYWYSDELWGTCEVATTFSDSTQFTPSQSGRYILGLYSDRASGTVISIKELRLNKGKTALSWESHNGCSMISKVGANGLCGIPVTDPTLANYTDKNGQMWWCDEIDCELEKRIKRIGLVDMGTLDWVASANNRFLASPPNLYLAKSLTEMPIAMMSVGYTASTAQQFNAYEKSYYISTDGRIGIKDTSYSDVTTFKSAMSGQMLCYPLATPIETDLTPDEITAYKALHTNKPNTVITNDCDAEMEVEYYTAEYDGAFGKVMREVALLREQVASLTATLTDVTSAMME